ncbi:hypothetical protein V1478_015605 [Vespula squamosa]|uniref:Uncharacterized protein n=1 Tax=Vespula squamosa TaxID=30214 RepID=A0ABD2A1C8_VESSQ
MVKENYGIFSNIVICSKMMSNAHAQRKDLKLLVWMPCCHGNGYKHGRLYDSLQLPAVQEVM